MGNKDGGTALDELIPLVLRRNPHFALSALLFCGGILGLACGVPAIAGALFGAGATMLGGWISLINTQQANAAEKSRRESDAKRYLTPELFRVVTRLLFVHQRALANYTCAALGHKMPKDEKIDFQPIMSILYPNAPQFHNLPGDDAVALVELYDSLYVLTGTVSDWHDRASQPPINIFNAVLHGVDQSLKQAKTCVERFDIDHLYPAKHASVETISHQIDVALTKSNQARENHIKHFEAEQKKTQHPKS